MKKIFLLVLFFFYPFFVFAQDVSHKKLDLSKETFLEQANNLFNYSKQLNDALPSDKIEQDLSQNIQANFKTSQEEAEKLESLVRGSIKTYRWGKDKYEKIKQLFLAPPIKPRDISDAELDKMMTNEDYHESEKTVVKTNFLRTIPYSFEPQHFKSMRKKYQEKTAKEEPKNEFEAFGRKIANLDYGGWLGSVVKPKYKQPTHKSTWEQKDDVSARLISAVTKVDNKPFLVAVQLYIDKGTTVLYKPQITFENSSNVKDAQIFYSIPKMFINNGELQALYSGNFAIPVLIYPQDSSKELLLNAQIKFESCKQDICTTVVLNPKFTMSSGVALRTDYANFIQTSYNARLLEYNDNKTIKKSYLDKKGNIVLDINKDYQLGKSFVYIQNQKVKEPLIQIKEDGFRAVFEPVGKVVNNNLDVLVFINHFDYGVFKTSLTTPKASNNFIAKNIKSGFYVHFYPWMLILFLMFLYSLPKKKEDVKKIFLMQIISLSVLLGLGALLALNFPYWTVQLNNIYYIITIVFIFIILFAIRKEWISYHFKHNHILYSFCVFLFWGLSTKDVLFNAPQYLFLILGFLLPYVLFYIFPSLVKKLPKPSESLNKINFILDLFLIISAFWFLIILKSYLGVALVLLSLFALKFFAKVKDALEIDFSSSKSSVFVAKKIVSAIVCAFYVICLVFINPINDNKQINIKEENSLIIISADWSLKSRFNDYILMLNNKRISISGIKKINMPYNQYSKEFLTKFNFYKPPFYMVFSNKYPKGLVLPQLLSEKELNKYVF